MLVGLAVVVGLVVAVVLIGGGGDSTITKEGVGADWPLTVDSVEVACIGERGGSGGQVLSMTADGVTYWLNGTAEAYATANGLDWHPTEEIWAEDRSLPGTRLDIRPVMEAALDTCP